MDIKRLIYDSAPVWWQNVMCTFAGYSRVRNRYGDSFERRCEFFRDAGKWSLLRSEEYQLKKLSEITNLAYEKVPYYRQSMQNLGLSPDFLKSFDDLRKLPVLSKEDVRKAGEDLISTDYKVSDLVLSHSGGSTGMPLTCYHDKDCLKDVYACFWEYHRLGVSISDKYATFQGMKLIPNSQKGGPYWRINKAMNQRLYSIYHISKDTVREYIEDLDCYRPVYIAAYANSIYLLAKLCKENSILPKWSPKAIYTTSEQLLSEYRNVIEDVFKTRVWDAYSQDETCASISQYECGYYHYDRTYGYIEFQDIEENGNRRLAEIICTGLLSHAWPLLRYRVGDVVEYESVDQCPGCGRPGPIIHEIRGRTGDVIIMPSGKYFPHISLIVKDLHGVRQLQLIQKSLNKIVVRFVPSSDFEGKPDEDKIISSFTKAMNEPMEWKIEKVDELQRTVSGKFRSIINEVKN